MFWVVGIETEGRPSLGWVTKKFRGLRVLEENSLNSRQGEQGP